MKVLCLVDENGIFKEDFEKGVELYLKNADVYYEVNDLGRVLHQIEKEGPGSVPIPKGLLKPEYKDIDVLLGGIYCPISRQIMDMFPNLKIVGTGRGGLENVDMEAAKEKGIMVVNGYGRNAEAVSDFTVGMILAEIRNIGRSYANLTKENGWVKDFANFPYSPHLCESTVGIFGLGYIGKLVAKKLAGFGAKITYCDPFVKDEEGIALGYTPVTKEELFANSDIVTIHCRLVDATRGIITKEDIERMKPTAFFINTARAGLVDYDALYDALINHRIGGAALDVYPTEPLPEDSPWRKLDNCTIASHLAGTVISARAFAAKLLCQSTVCALKGEIIPQIITKDVINDSKFKEFAEKALKEIQN